MRDARFRSSIRSAAAESWKLCSRASDLYRLHAAAAFDLNPQRETDRRFGAGQAAAPEGCDPSRRAAYREIAGAARDFAGFLASIIIICRLAARAVWNEFGNRSPPWPHSVWVAEMSPNSQLAPRSSIVKVSPRPAGKLNAPITTTTTTTYLENKIANHSSS